MRRLLVLALVFLAAACSKPHPNVVLLSIDTLRADRLGKGLTPHLDAFARDAMRFDETWSHCPLTLPSHTSILTGTLPPQHGVRDNAGYHLDAARHRTLASVLRDNGYRTGAAVSAFVLRGDSGLSDGFDLYDDAIGAVEGAPTGAVQRPGRATAAIARSWIGAESERPWFFFLHLFEPHTPHAKSYDDDVRDADAIAGEFLQFLRDLGAYDDALIVILSDHGEGLGDHGEEEHGVFLYREALQVPLLVKFPRGAHAGPTGRTAQLADVMPTILDALGVAAPEGVQGRSLLRDAAPRASYAESLYPRLHLGWSELRSVVRGSMQYIEAPRPELYDLRTDPRQRRNLASTDRRALHELRGELASFGGAFSAPAAVTPEEQKKLAALGYVSAAGGEEPSAIDPKDRIADLVRLSRAGAMRGRGDESAAVAEMEALLGTNPKWSDLRDELGDLLSARGEHARALQVFEGGITASPKLAPAFALNAATELLELGRLDEAESHARFAAEAGLAEAHVALGEVALERGHLDAALGEARSAARSASLVAHAAFLEARVAAARRDFPAAVVLLGKVQQEQRRTGGSLPRHFHYAAGDVLARLGKMNEARLAFEAEIARDPSNVAAYTHLASIDRLTGNAAGAERTLRRARERGLRIDD